MADTREKILIAALELFSVRGYTAVGTRAIAEAAGVNEVTLFRTFGSKERLWVEVFRRYVVRPEPGVLLAGATGDPAADLPAAARAIAALLRANVKLLKMNLRHEGQDPEIEAELADQPRQMVAVLSGHLSACGRSLAAPPEVVARTLVDTLFGVVIHFEAQGKPPTAGALDRWLDDFLPLFLTGAVS